MADYPVQLDIDVNNILTKAGPFEKFYKEALSTGKLSYEFSLSLQKSWVVTQGKNLSD